MLLRRFFVAVAAFPPATSGIKTIVEGLGLKPLSGRTPLIRFHTRQESHLLTHGRVEIRERAVLAGSRPLGVPLARPRVAHVILHQNEVCVLIRSLLRLFHFDPFVQKVDALVVFFLQLGLQALVLNELQSVHLELLKRVVLRTLWSELAGGYMWRHRSVADRRGQHT